MRTARNGVLVVSALIVALSSRTWAADRLIRMRFTVEGMPRAVEESYYWTDGKKVVDGERLRVIVDYEHRSVLTLDKRDRTYRTASLDDTRRGIEGMTAMMTRALHRVPRDKREGMGIAGFDPRPHFTLRPSGRRDHIAGFAAYELMLAGGPVEGSIWVTPHFRRPPDDRAWAPFTERFAGLEIQGSKLASALARLGGWPVRVELSTPGNMIVRSELLEMREEMTAPDLLTVPDGYHPAADDGAANAAGLPASRGPG